MDADSLWCDAVVETPFSDTSLLAIVQKFIGVGSPIRSRTQAETDPIEFDHQDIATRLDSILSPRETKGNG
jgi:hypothetical protein